MATQTRPTDQRAGVKPISFVLQKQGGFSTPVTLRIRPEDLTRVEPDRTVVTQTLGRSVQGWVDDFGAGIPSLNIAGHTGWRTASGSGEDGAASFETLNKLIKVDYHKARQDAIDAGIDPASVKLVFVDTLDGFTWSVAPTSFTLRRSKSRPLLFQYNISLQAVSTDIDNPFVVLPFSGSLFAGLGALATVANTIAGYATTIKGWIATAVAYKDAALAPIASAVSTFTNLTASILGSVNSVIAAGEGAVSSTANSLIGIAGDLAKVGTNVARTIANIEGIPGSVMASISEVASAFNEAYCILKNSLKPKSPYDDYSDLFGASNCSSTTGGSSASVYVSSNVFSLMQADTAPVMLTSGAVSSITTLGNADPVLAPISLTDLNRNLTAINSGVTLQ